MATMYAMHNTWRFEMCSLTQKGGIMRRKKSRFHIVMNVPKMPATVLVFCDQYNS